jgi:predicted short-subunit dehydrogenase-like oxidoreductase (DUF2520 family)
MYDTAEELAGECDLLLLTVPDGKIHDVWARLREALPAGRSEKDRALFIAHCSGSLDSRIFDLAPAESAFVSFGSIHPLVAVHDRETAFKNLDGAYFTIEGGPKFTKFAAGLLTGLGNPFCRIDARQKTLYHAASVLVSNLVCALAYEGMETFAACGLDSSFAESAWRALFLGNAENIAKLGPVSALTGPVERADTATIARHIAALTGDTKEMYILLSRTLVETAQRKNPDRDYSGLMSLLSECP